MKLRMPTFRGLGSGLKLFFIGALMFVIGALLSFWWLLPVEPLQQRVLQEISRETGVQMQAQNTALMFPGGLRMDMVIRSQVPELNDFAVDNLRLRPVWTSLVTGSPAVSMKGLLAGGAITSTMTGKGALDTEVRGLDILRLLRADLPYRLGGVLSAQVKADRLLGGARQAEGAFTVDVGEAVALGLDQIGFDPELPLGRIQVTGQFENMRVNLERAVITGGALEVNGSGTIFAGATPAKTRLNLSVRLQPTARTPAGLRDLLSLTGARPDADGSYQFQIGGTLARPVMR